MSDETSRSQPRHGQRQGRAPLSLFDAFSRAEWAGLGADPLDLADEALAGLAGIYSTMSLAEMHDVFGPLCRLLNLRVQGARTMAATIERALFGRPRSAPPFIIAVAGSVAVGKSTFSRVLRALLAGGTAQRRVDLVATDGFLYPTAVLTERDLMRRKGFPESYDLKRMLAFLADLKAGEPLLQVPMYSHESYDIVAGEFQLLQQPDIVIFEGLNVLQTAGENTVVASDYFDFSIYLDAEPDIIEAWYIERFLVLQRTVFCRPTSYFHHYRDLTPDAAREVARQIWRTTNLPNLRQNIQPTRERADLVLRKGQSHSIEEVWLRRQGR